MKTYEQEGEFLTLTTPGGGVTKGSAYKVGSLIVLAQKTIASGDAATENKFAAMVTGVAQVAKATGATWSEGQKLYWDDSAKKFTPTSSSNTLCGVAVAAATSGATTGLIRLDGVVR